MTIDEMIAVLTAAKAGKQLQLRFATEPDSWDDCSKPCFDFSRFDYRVKPEPREWDAWVTGSVLLGSKPVGYAKKIKVREVL